jgi:hypothetical protein
MIQNAERRRRERLARKAARMLNSISVPGVWPMTWRGKLFILLVLLVVAASVIGLAALTSHPR